MIWTLMFLAHSRQRYEICYVTFISSEHNSSQYSVCIGSRIFVHV